VKTPFRYGPRGLVALLLALSIALAWRAIQVSTPALESPKSKPRGGTIVTRTKPCGPAWLSEGEVGLHHRPVQSARASVPHRVSRIGRSPCY